MKRWLSAFTILFLLGLLLATLNWPLHLHPTIVMLYAALSVAGATIWQKWNLAKGAPNAEAIRTLAQFNDLRAIGPLVEALEWSDSKTRRVAEHALINLLPHLQSGDDDCLNARQRAILCRALRGKKAPFIIAILKAFEQVGDAKAIPIVERLAEGYVTSSEEKLIRRTAQECLPYLRQRAEQEMALRTMLRPSSVPVVPLDSLLPPPQSHLEDGPKRKNSNR